jgi:hypothetical protein
MVIALLAMLGVNLIVLVAFVGSVVIRKRWVRHEPGAFPGVVRVVDGEVHGLGPKWHRGYGRWVSDVLVWTKGPFLFRNELAAVDGLEGQRPGRPDEVKHVGDRPVVIRVRSGDATVEIAAGREDSRLLLGPYGNGDALITLGVPATAAGVADTTGGT